NIQTIISNINTITWPDIFSLTVVLIININPTDHSWSRRCSTETVFSIQGKETDVSELQLVDPAAMPGVVTGSSGPEDMTDDHYTMSRQTTLKLIYFS
ncbi:hypothetical protein HF086_009483, partial [Spodoptera exigua]